MKILNHILLLLSLSALVAQAGTISIVLDNPNPSGKPGDTLSFYGTIYNSGTDTVYLNASSPSFGLSAASETFSDNFFTNVPLSLAGSSNSGDIDLFDILLSNPFADPLGTYNGTYNLLGGVDANAQDILVSADFSVTLSTSSQNPPSTGGGGIVPEPGTFGIGALAILGLAALASSRAAK